MLACCKRRKTLRWPTEWPKWPSIELQPKHPAREPSQAFPQKTVSFGMFKANLDKAIPKGIILHQTAQQIILSFSSLTASNAQPHLSCPNFEC